MKRLIISLLVLVFALVLTSCNKESSSDDRAEIMALINGTYSWFFNEDGASSSTEPGGNGNVLPADATQPAHWWRSITRFTRIITIDFPYDGHAVVEVDDTVEGELHVDRTFDGKLNDQTRVFNCKRTRYCTFDESGNTWYLTGISLAHWYMSDSADQKVKITSMRIKGPGFDRTFTDTTQIIPFDDLPTFSHNDAVTVTAVTTNSSTAGYVPKTFSYLHYTLFNREPMIESPSGTFSESFSASGGTWGNTAADAMDSACLQTETGSDYNWEVCGLPYKLQ